MKQALNGYLTCLMTANLHCLLCSILPYILEELSVCAGDPLVQ